MFNANNGISELYDISKLPFHNNTICVLVICDLFLLYYSILIIIDATARSDQQYWNSWAIISRKFDYCQIRNIAGCACTGNVGNIFLTTNVKINC